MYSSPNRHSVETQHSKNAPGATINVNIITTEQ